MTGQQTHTANAQQSYTLASHTTCPETSGSQRTDQSYPKSMPAPTQEKYEVFTNTFETKNDVSKIQNIFSCPSKKIKTPDTQADTTKTVKLNNDNGLQGRWKRTTGYNKVLPRPVPNLREAGLYGFNWAFPAKAGQVVQGSTFVLLLNFSRLGGTGCAKNPAFGNTQTNTRCLL
ncbi:MAG: hypothetical protein JSS64_13015 [Bacteroidetes bacterium]|nr:hypothetical protein [Bacteroidota bacterium]